MTAIPAEDVTYWYDQARRAFVAPGRPDLPLPTLAAAWDWSDSNLPWVYDTPADLTAGWPASTLVVDLADGSGDFYSRLAATVNAAPGRCVVRLPAGVHTLTSFRMIGSSGSPTYAFGFWWPKLQGFLGQGAAQTVIEMGPDSMSQAQLDALSLMKSADFAPNLMGLCRFDGTTASPVLISGVTFRAHDQQNITSKPSSTDWYGAVVPQPAPHTGVIVYSGSPYLVQFCRFQGAGKALTAAPPFEHSNLGSQYSPSGIIRRCELDGRRAPEVDPARPRVCGPIMVNNETLSSIEDSWLHHSNVSRYAANDENRDTRGVYRLLRTKIEQISTTRNDGMGGSNNQASAAGWESVNGTIEITDCMLGQDNPHLTGSLPHHVSLTSTGSRNPQGGRLIVRGGKFRNVHPSIDGFLSVRAVSTTYWALDGPATTMAVYDERGVRKTAYQVPSGAWPPSASSLAAAGVTPATHFLVRG